ncbi:MAG: hypothetical protein WCH59_09155 [Chitinophagia bacterium]|jgi:hypothetical protein
MKLKTFNAENTFSQRQAKPFISVSAKTGLFAFNRGAYELLALKSGDHVQFHQEEDSPENWYIEKVKDGGFTLREYKETSLLINNTTLARTIFDSVDSEKMAGRLIIGEQVKIGKQTLHTLVTASLK